jgi:hypothetical protein
MPSRCIERVCEAVYRLADRAEALMPGHPWGDIRSTSEHQRGLERVNVRADPPVERAGRRRQASERETPLTVAPG